MKKIVFVLAALLINISAFAQEPEMADALRSSGKIYVVVGTIAIIFVGLAAYLFSLDRRLSKLEKQK